LINVVKRIPKITNKYTKQDPNNVVKIVVLKLCKDDIERYIRWKFLPHASEFLNIINLSFSKQGYEEEEMVFSYTGNGVPPSYVSKISYLRIKFQSDTSVNFPGFQANVRGKE